MSHTPENDSTAADPTGGTVTPAVTQRERRPFSRLRRTVAVATLAVSLGTGVVAVAAPAGAAIARSVPVATCSFGRLNVELPHIGNVFGTYAWANARADVWNGTQWVTLAHSGWYYTTAQQAWGVNWFQHQTGRLFRGPVPLLVNVSGPPAYFRVIVSIVDDSGTQYVGATGGYWAC